MEERRVLKVSEIILFLGFEPVKGANEWAGMGGFRSEYDCASKRVLNALKTRQFVSREREIEGVAIVKFRMNETLRLCRQF